MRKSPKKAVRHKKYRGVLYPQNWKEVSREAQSLWRQAIDEVKGPLNSYTKKITPVYDGVCQIEFSSKLFKRLKTIKYRKTFDQFKEDNEDHFYLKDLDDWNVYDFTRYNKQELQHMVKDFVTDHSLKKLDARLKAIRVSNKFISSHKYPLIQEYTNEYLAALHKYQQTRRPFLSKALNRS